MNIDWNCERFSLAIETRRIMIYKKRVTSQEDLNEEINEFVAKPMREFMADFAQHRPRQVVCFAGKPFDFKKKPGNICQDLYLFNHEDECAYIGTVFNKQAMVAFSQNLSLAEQEDVKVRPEAIRRINTFYVIPSKTDEIDIKTLILAVRRVLRTYGKMVPFLVKTTISFLSAEKGFELNKKICAEAKRRAQNC